MSNIKQLKIRLHSKLIDKINIQRLSLDMFDPASRERFKLKKLAQTILINLLNQEQLNYHQKEEIIKDVLDAALGLGPLEDLINDATITEIMVNNKDRVYIERHGKIESAGVCFDSNEQLMTIIHRILAPLGRRIDQSSAYVDARLEDGSRVNAIIPPLSLNGPTLTIRKFNKYRYSIDDLVTRMGSLTQDMADFLKESVKMKKNILVSGGTGSGKTTFLNVLSEFIEYHERIITIEDSAELKLHHQHWIRLESKMANIEGRGRITMRDLFCNSLRMRPDRIIVGECRGPEVLDMLQAMNTGHSGSMSTIHANSPKDTLIRLTSMILMNGIELPIRAMREMISSAIDLIVHIGRLPDGSRKVLKISEIGCMRGNYDVEMKDIFVLSNNTPCVELSSFGSRGL